MKEGVDCNLSLRLTNSVRAEISSGKCPCELCSTNGLAMEKELYIESVGDASSSGASKSCICVLKPPATNEWLTPKDPVQYLRKIRRHACKHWYQCFSAPFVSKLTTVSSSGDILSAVKGFSTILMRLLVSGDLITLPKTRHLRLMNLFGHCCQPMLRMLPGSSPISLTLFCSYRLMEL